MAGVGPEIRGYIEITADERNQLWDMMDFAYGGAAESLTRQRQGAVPHDCATEVRMWLSALDVVGYEAKSESGCEVPLSLPFIYAVEGAERQALEVLADESKALTATITRMSAEQATATFFPLGDEEDMDAEKQYIAAICRIKAIRERMEAAEPGLRGGAGAVAA